MAPGIEEKFNALGYHFKDTAQNRKFKNKKENISVEIDVLLENDDYSVAVEVKSKPRETDIDVFKRRLGLLRKYKDSIQDSHKIHGESAAVRGSNGEDGESVTPKSLLVTILSA